MELRAEKKVSAMVPIYGSLIVKGEKTLSSVPASIVEDVREWLINNGYEELAE